jgi:uncharacterized protein
MLKEAIKNDLNKAIKEQNSLFSGTLRMLLAAISNKEKEKKYKEGSEELAEEEVLNIVVSEAKKRKEAIESFKNAQRLELAEKEESELKVLEKYLPEQLSEEELKNLVQEAINEVSCSGVKDMGKVMAVLMPKIKGKADGSQVSQIVKELLQ